MLSKEEIEKTTKDKEDAYWKGWVQKQNEAGEICKMCNYRKKARRLAENRQKLIEKLEEEYNEIINKRRQLAFKAYTKREEMIRKDKELYGEQKAFRKKLELMKGE